MSEASKVYLEINKSLNLNIVYCTHPEKLGMYLPKAKCFWIMTAKLLG